MSGLLSNGSLDWQFVAVTLAAAWGGWVLLRPLWPTRSAKKNTGACGRCSSPDCTKPPDPGSGATGLVRIGKPRS
jgi:hypothetical protein